MRSELQVAQFADMLMALRCEECWTSSAGNRRADRAKSHRLAAGRRAPPTIKQASGVGFGNPTAPSTHHQGCLSGVTFAVARPNQNLSRFDSLNKSFNAIIMAL